MHSQCSPYSTLDQNTAAAGCDQESGSRADAVVRLQVYRISGVSALVPNDQSNLVFPDKVIRVRVRENILSEYFWLVLQTPPLRAQISAVARTAVGNYAIGGRDIWYFEIPLPPLPVQRKLVERVTAARAEIARERAAADQLAQTVAAEVETLILGQPAHKS